MALSAGRRVDWSGLRLTSFDAEAAGATAAAKKGPANALRLHDEEERVITSIDLSCNFVHVFDPAHVAPFAHLLELYLGANELAEVPDLSPLVCLRRLHLNNNRLTAIPATLHHLRTLEILDFRSNRIPSCEGLPSLPALRWLSLSSNAVTDAGFSSSLLPPLASLTFFGLYGNQLTDADAVLAVLQLRCPGLTELVVADNRWSSGRRFGLDIAAWASLSRLEWLDAEYVDRRVAVSQHVVPGHTDKRVRADADAS